MKKITSILFVFFIILSGCIREKNLKMALENYYLELNTRSGGGNNELSAIEIISFNDKTVTAIVSGYSKNNSLATPTQQDFKDTLVFTYIKKKNGYKVSGMFPK